MFSGLKSWVIFISFITKLFVQLTKIRRKNSQGGSKVNYIIKNQVISGKLRPEIIVPWIFMFIKRKKIKKHFLPQIKAVQSGYKKKTEEKLTLR